MILIDMEMPNNCSTCNLHNEVGLCLANDSDADYRSDSRPGTCPLYYDGGEVDDDTK